MKIATRGAPSPTPMWSGSLCQNRFLAASTADTIFWAAAQQNGSGSASYSTGTTDFYLMPKTGGDANLVTRESAAVDSVAMDHGAVYWDVYGLYQSYSGNVFKCTNGRIMRMDRANRGLTTIGLDESCPSAIRSDGANVYWFDLPSSPTGVGIGFRIRESVGGTASPQSLAGFSAVYPLWTIADGIAYFENDNGYYPGALLWSRASWPGGTPASLPFTEPGPDKARAFPETVSVAGSILAWVDNVDYDKHRVSFVSLAATGDPKVLLTDVEGYAMVTDGSAVYAAYTDFSRSPETHTYLVAVTAQ